MLTQCPQCSTVFRLPLTLLEAAEGRVRCGHCGAVFDASGDLPSDIQKLLSQHAPATGAEDGPDVLLTAGQEEDDTDVPEFELSEEELDDVLVEAESSTADTAENEILDLQIAAALAQEDITLEGQKVSIFNEQTGEFRTFAANAPSASDDSQEDDSLESDEAGARADASDPDRWPATGESGAGESDTGESGAAAELSPAEFAALTGSHRAFREPPPRPRLRVLLWTAASLLLLLALIAQVVHFNRARLAGVPGLGPVLVDVYSLLGLRLTPAWEVGAYRVRQWGASADDNGALRVRASVFNTAAHPQPYPLLRLTLQNRFGEPLGTRDLQPRDYLPATPAGAPRASNRLLAPGQRIDAQIALVDPGKNAIGFELDACLRDEHTSVRCANDLRRKAD